MEEEKEEAGVVKREYKQFTPFKFNKKRGRIVIRNLSYSVTEDKLKEHFSQYGEIDEINLLRRPDQKLVGCAFIQYKFKNDAGKAIHQTNDKEYLSRKLKVDWAISKDRYETQNPPKDDPKLKEKLSKNKNNNSSIKSEDDISIKSESEDEDSIKSENVDNFESENHGSIKSEDDMEEYSENDDEDVVENKQAKDKKVSNDVSEGCTVFIKEIPFDLESNDLRKLLLRFGKIYYVILNRDKISGHSKGTGFVKFKKKESADLCLHNNYSIKVQNNVLEFFPAMSRTDIQNKMSNEKQKDVRDTRNLYLLKEGVIYANSKSAEGVSANDMAIRLRLEQKKTEMLKNLNHFVSRQRLTIHNLPDDYDNKKLFEMVMKFTNIKPIECRVMRDNNITAKHPVGKTKNFGFLKYKEHDDALLVLRKVNNNPSIFTKNRRPIISFSLEDKSVINVKTKRAEKSKLSNPTYQKKLEAKKLRRKLKRQAHLDSVNNKNMSDPASEVNEMAHINLPKVNKRKNKKNKGKVEENQEINTPETTETTNFSGLIAERGAINLRKNHKINDQISQHTKSVQKIKKEIRKNKEKREILKEKRQSDRMKPKVKIEKDVEFTELVNKHKRMLENAAAAANPEQKQFKRTKWYQD